MNLNWEQVCKNCFTFYFRNFFLLIEDVILGLNVALMSMKQNEKSHFIFEKQYTKGCKPEILQQDTPVLFIGLFFKINIKY